MLASLPPLFCSAQKQQISQKALAAGVSVAVGAALASPMVAQAAVTPSLQNFLGSLVAGAVVLSGIAIAITTVSKFDTVNRD